MEKQTNRNGRMGLLTAWDSKAQDYFKKLYLIYAEHKEKIYLEREDINFLISCYKGKEKRQRKELIYFMARQFKLMGYPQENESKKEQKKGYIEIIGGLIVLDFGFNIDRINKELFSNYWGKKAVIRFNEQNEAQESPINNEKAQGNDLIPIEIVNKQDTNIYELKGGND